MCVYVCVLFLTKAMVGSRQPGRYTKASKEIKISLDALVYLQNRKDLVSAQCGFSLHF